MIPRRPTRGSQNHVGSRRLGENQTDQRIGNERCGLTSLNTQDVTIPAVHEPVFRPPNVGEDSPKVDHQLDPLLTVLERLFNDDQEIDVRGLNGVPAACNPNRTI